jgi:F0F1-type ATP synthase membrane subunit a
MNSKLYCGIFAVFIIATLLVNLVLAADPAVDEAKSKLDTLKQQTADMAANPASDYSWALGFAVAAIIVMVFLLFKKKQRDFIQ